MKFSQIVGKPKQKPKPPVEATPPAGIQKHGQKKFARMCRAARRRGG